VSGVDAFVQIGLELLHHAGPVSGAVAGQQFLHRVGAGEAAHGAAREIQLAADRLDANAIGEQGVHLGVTLPGADRPPVCPVTGPGKCRMIVWADLVVGTLLLADVGVAADLDRQGGGQAVLMLGEGAFDRIGQVLPQVPATCTASGAPSPAPSA
jgi:hypothetical protein